MLCMMTQSKVQFSLRLYHLDDSPIASGVILNDISEYIT